MQDDLDITGGARPDGGAAVDRQAPAAAVAGGRAGRWDLLSRLLLPLAAAALLISPRHPYWNMKLNAPQYPRGLSLVVYPDHVAGDVEEIDGLNHYIGMRKIGG